MNSKGEFNMNITKEQLDQLTRIYNTMFEINTKGEDTLVMADCLRALEQVIVGVKQNPVLSENNNTFKSIDSEKKE